MTAPVQHQVGDRTFELPVLEAGQIIDLADEVRSIQLARIMALPIDDAAKAERIEQLDERSGAALDVLNWAYRAKGTVRVIEESLKLLDGDAPTIEDLELDLSRDHDLAARLLGFSEYEKIKARAIERAAAAEAGADPTSSKPTAPDGTSSARSP